ncbi:MAG: hypothetical protein JW810_02980 [Sedimentisphaerales bacterium]|nr:hypothetical protein [Sedimentisphaerales bacterium]
MPVWIWAVLAAGASGVMMSACYWPLVWHPAAWIALVPVLAALPRLRADTAFLIGAVLGLVFYRISLAWLVGLSGLHAAIVMVILAILVGLSLYIARLLMSLFGTAAMIWAVPLAFVGQEILRTESLDRWRFAYAGWGYSQSPNPWIAQIASLGGVFLLSFLIVSWNAAVAYGLTQRRKHRWIPAAVIAVLIIALGVIAQPPSYEDRPAIGTACIQLESNYHRMHRDLTAEALNDPHQPWFVVLPEHTITEYTTEKHYLVRECKKLAQQHHAYICIGAHWRAPRQADCDYDNTATLIGPDGGILYAQSKAVPIPFFTDGNLASEQRSIPTEYGQVGCLVCYDGGFTDVSRRLASLGAELLLVPVMNPESWPAQQRWQQAAMAPFRSIELRRCAVRAASSGISQIIEATGRVQAQRTQEQGPGILLGNVYTVKEPSFFARWGHLFSHITGWIFLIASVILIPAHRIWQITTRIARWRKRRQGAEKSGPDEPACVFLAIR